MKRHLAELGFTNVHNQCEDFYARLRAQDLPEHDVLLTNPPYSSDHLQKIIRHVTTSGKPWLLLVPNFVYIKEYYRSATRRVPSVRSRPYHAYSMHAVVHRMTVLLCYTWHTVRSPVPTANCNAGGIPSCRAVLHRTI